MPLRILSLLILAGALMSAAVHAQENETKAKPTGEQSIKPGINEKFLDPELKVADWVARFETESREVFASRHQIVKAMKLKAGDRIADIGTGTGAFVEPFALAVQDSGWVYAIDIAPKFIERVGKLSQERKLDNVTPVLGGEKDIRLAPGTVNKAFICDVYHHFEFPKQSMASIHRALKPSGELILIDFERIPGVSREWTLGHVRAGKDEFRKEIVDAGFEFVEEVKIEGFKENYFLRFRRR